MGCLEPKPLDLYRIVKLRKLDGNVNNDYRHSKLSDANVKSMNDGVGKFRDCYEINWREIDEKKKGTRTTTTPSKLTDGKCLDTFASENGLLTWTPVCGTAESRETFIQKNIAREGTADLGLNLADLLPDERIFLYFVDSMTKGRGHDQRTVFKFGDMVWGKVEPYPWWPGIIFDEALASLSVCDTKIKGFLLVAFFGDATYSWFDPARLIPFEPHFVKKSKQTKARGFLVAVNEAVAEISRRAALGLACSCRKFLKIRDTNVQGFVKVDLSGFAPGGLYSREQIERAREDFQPIETLAFVQQLALNPMRDAQQNVGYMRNAAKFLAYRKAVFCEFDMTYAQAFGVEPLRYGDSVAVSTERGKMMSQASLGGECGRSTTSSKCNVIAVCSKGNTVSGTASEKKESDQTLRKRCKPDNPVKDRKKKTVPGRAKGKTAPCGPSGTASEKKENDHAIERTQKPDSPLKDRKKKSSSSGNVQMSMDNITDRRKFKSLAALETPRNQESNEVYMDIEKELELVDEPAILTIIFPHTAKLPSVPEIKLRFSRFRSIDTSSIRVSWSSSTCQVLFLSENEAKAAYAHAKSTRPFGNTRVKYMLQPLGTSASRTKELEVSAGENVNKAPDNDPPSFPCHSASPASFNPIGSSIHELNRHVDAMNKIYHLSQQASSKKDTTTTNSSEVDISGEMLTLMTKCSDIVAGLKNAHGGEP